MGAVLDELLELERGFWSAAGDRDRYAAALAADALHVLPGLGVVEREPVLDAVADAAPWSGFEILEPRVLALGDGAAALVYSARARREGEEPYAAAITSVYRRTGGRWLLTLHQQTPAPLPAGG